MSTNNGLVEYVAAADPAYRWERLGSTRVESGTLYDLCLVSQTWQAMDWRHRLHLYVPDRIFMPEWAQITIGSDHADLNETTRIDLELAAELGIVSAHLFDVPNQPLFDGLREDELLAHSLVQYLDTSDPTWPLLFPMVKASVRALDAVSELCAAVGQSAPTKFVVHGASKRGWATWLTAVVDPRVRAIVPEVYDNLNLFAQMPHQVKMWHAYSEMIEDYTEHHLQDRMRTPKGQEVALTVDPYTYRSRLALPKLLIQSLNDRYWATDALNLYWDDLVGEKYVVWAPNQGHNIGDRSAIRPTYAAFLRAVLQGSCLPEITAEYEDGPAGIAVSVRSMAPAVQSSLWIAISATQDFRSSRWEPKKLTAAKDGRLFTGVVPWPATGHMAVAAECLLPHESRPYVLSTQVRIFTSGA